jgi:hypothetical protein
MRSDTPLVSTLTRDLVFSYASLISAWSNLSEAELTRKGTVGAWSFKDALGHVAAWDLWLVETIPRRLAGEVLTPEQRRALDDRDAWNADQVALRDHFTRAEQQRESAQTMGAVLQLVRTLGDAVLARPDPWPSWERTTSMPP